jgi:hypothetical protein
MKHEASTIKHEANPIIGLCCSLQPLVAYTTYTAYPLSEGITLTLGPYVLPALQEQGQSTPAYCLRPCYRLHTMWCEMMNI